jgi:hypothetical protein
MFQQDGRVLDHIVGMGVFGLMQPALHNSMPRVQIVADIILDIWVAGFNMYLETTHAMGLVNTKSCPKGQKLVQYTTTYKSGAVSRGASCVRDPAYVPMVCGGYLYANGGWVYSRPNGQGELIARYSKYSNGLEDCSPIVRSRRR